ncbi:MAG: metallopeptidase family protein [Candidatus Eisenbacteria bacterium]
MDEAERVILEKLDAIEGSLDGGDPEAALRLADEALADFPDVPDLLALRGDALWALGDVRGASEDYTLAVELLPDAGDLLAGLARIRFSLSDFLGARRSAKEALKHEERAEALDVLSRLAERAGRLDEANRLADRATRIDPEGFPRPFRLPEREFLRAVEEAIDRLPERFRAAVREKNVAVLVEPVPPDEILIEEDPPFDPAILGLYRGIPLPEREAASQQVPDTIHLFRHNLERVAADRATLVEEIAVTVYHELGHFFGLDEEELEDLDLD